MKPQNPFPTFEYISPEYFCDRETELQQIIESVDNQRNITIISRRRLGKTALIRQSFYHLKKRKDLSLHYFDIYATRNLHEFINMLSTALVGYFESKPEKVLGQMIKLLGQFRPKLSFDELSGTPSVELSLQTDAEKEQSLSAIFDYLSTQKQRVVIAIDEFQQITNYPEKNVEALLRTHIQSSNNVTMIYSGSNRHMLISLFNEYARPFYQSSSFLFLDKIDPQQYKKFIVSHFEKEGRKISENALLFILDWAQGHTYFVQEICNRLYSSEIAEIDTGEVKQITFRILEERTPLYQVYQNVLTVSQYALLNAIAMEKTLEKPNASAFIAKYKLGAASSVNRSLAALEAKDLILFENNSYSLTDIFLMRWLQRQ
ncbi:MAG: ATP-binding protein [Lentimicrobiaceae bacterium]|jgi:AAA+ ATPase superfamily predicted ATPase